VVAVGARHPLGPGLEAAYGDLAGLEQMFAKLGGVGRSGASPDGKQDYDSKQRTHDNLLQVTGQASEMTNREFPKKPIGRPGILKGTFLWIA
jgi:hypothetical protein